MLDSLWYEKYRPKSLKELILPKAHRKLFKKYIRNKEFPHLLLYGPAGSGKTTIARILIDNCASGKLILNASAADRGIGTIKTKVKQFASAKRRDTEKLNVVFFDEANGLTPEAQEALKNPIETYHKNCRFIFTTNEFDKITPPIASRCMLFKFDSYPKKSLLQHLIKIIEKEEVEYKIKDVQKVIERYYPDVRTIMNVLESCSISGTLNIKEVLSVVNFKSMKYYLDKGKIFALRHMFSGGNDFLFVYRWLFNEYAWQLPEELRSEAALTIAEYLHRDRSITDREINLSACCLELMNLQEIDLDFKEPF